MQALSEVGSLRGHCRDQLLIAGERPAELGGQHGAAAAHQGLDNLRVAQHGLLRDLVARDLAHHQLQRVDASALERGVAEALERWQRVELVDDPVDVDHRSASPIATGMPCSSSVATEARSTRRPT